MGIFRNLFNPHGPKGALDIGLFILRAGVGLLMAPHGLKKLQNFSEKSEGFYDFLNLGGQFSMGLTIFSELVCSVLLVLGIGTRLILIPLIITMLVVVLIVHGPDPLGDKESGLLFLIPYVTLLFTGPGRISVDHLIYGKNNQVK